MWPLLAAAGEDQGCAARLRARPGRPRRTRLIRAAFRARTCPDISFAPHSTVPSASAPFVSRFARPAGSGFSMLDDRSLKLDLCALALAAGVGPGGVWLWAD